MCGIASLTLKNGRDDDEKDMMMMKSTCWPVEQSKQNYRGKEVGRGPGRPTELGEDPCGRRGRAGQAGCVQMLGSLGAEPRKVSAQGVAYLHSIKGGAPRELL